MLPVRAAQRVGRSGATGCHNSGDITTLSPQVLLADEKANSRLPVEMNVAAFRFALLRDSLGMVGNPYLGITFRVACVFDLVLSAITDTILMHS
jgi:hypothetical protein